MAEEELCLARQVEDQKDVVSLKLLKPQRFDGLGVPEDIS